MSSKSWIYFGVFLDGDSRNRLLTLTKKNVDKDWKLFCHHMTIAFNNGSDAALSLYNQYQDYFGAKTEIVATHIGYSDDAIALKIDFKGLTQNKTPHVTLATPPNGKPVNSNYIKNWKPLNEPITLFGRFDVFR